MINASGYLVFIITATLYAVYLVVATVSGDVPIDSGLLVAIVSGYLIYKAVR